MISAVQIQSLRLPAKFIFDSLRLYAKFISAAVDLFALKFSASSFQRERSVNLNVQVKIPATRPQFILVLEVIIINMHIPSIEIPIDLNSMGEWNQYELIFQTQMGEVAMDVNFIEEIYLPKLENKISHRKWVPELADNDHRESQLSEQSLVQQYNTLRLNQPALGKTYRKALETNKQTLRKNYSSKRKIGQKSQKMNLSRSEYMKLDIDESILECEHGNTETESDLKPKIWSLS